MSMMEAGGPPPSIQLPGGGRGGQGRPTSGDAGDNSDNLRTAIDALQEYIGGETDDQDLAAANKIQAELQKLLADQQALVDKATGAGPGARLVRKASGGGSSY